jgi:hypothetical protein
MLGEFEFESVLTCVWVKLQIREFLKERKSVAIRKRFIWRHFFSLAIGLAGGGASVA